MVLMVQKKILRFNTSKRCNYEMLKFPVFSFKMSLPKFEVNKHCKFRILLLQEELVHLSFEKWIAFVRINGMPTKFIWFLLNCEYAIQLSRHQW